MIKKNKNTKIGFCQNDLLHFLMCKQMFAIQQKVSNLKRIFVCLFVEILTFILRTFLLKVYNANHKRYVFDFL